MTSPPPTFKPIHADFWQDFDAWEKINPMDCHRFKNGFVQLNRGGYWFPYVGEYTADSMAVNMVKPHVLV